MLKKEILTLITPVSGKPLCLPAMVLLISLFLPNAGWADKSAEVVSMTSLLKKELAELVELEVSLSTGTSKPLNLAPSVATVITAEDIESMGAMTLDEALETVPGLHMSLSNKTAARPVTSMRGIHTSLNPQVLFLVNGHPMRDMLTGARPLGFKMLTYNISRVEIIRGPGSAVYGADAFAGTINVITKNASEINGTQSGLRYGSFDTMEAWLQHGGRYSGWDVAVNLAGRKSSGDSNRIVDADLQTTIDAAMGTSASVAPGPLDTSYNLLDLQTSFVKDNWTIRLRGLLNSDIGLLDSATNTLTTDGHGDLDQYLGEVIYRNDRLIRDTELSLGGSYLYIKQDTLVQLFPPGAVIPIGADGNIDFVTPAGFTLFTDGVYGRPIQSDHQTSIDFNAIYKGWNSHRWRIAAGFQSLTEKQEEYKNFGPGILDGSQPVVDGSMTDVTGTPYIYMKDHTRNLWYASLQDEWSFAKGWELTAGLRYDNYSDFGSTINPRIALVWQTTTDLTTKLLYGRAFRPPSFNELYIKNNPSNQGNPDLKPETIQTLELVFDYRPSTRLHTALNLFAYEIKDLIELVQDPGQTTLTSQNHKDQEGQGFEVEADWLVTDTLRLKGNFAYQRSKDKKTGESVPDAPGVKFYANAHWKFATDWSLDGQYIWVGDRHRANSDSRPEIKDYDLVNLTLRRKNIMEHLDLAVAVRNLFDEDAREPSQPSIPNDYPMEGRSLWAELRYNF